MFRLLLLLFPLAIAAFAAKPTGYSTDMVMLKGSQVMQTTKLYVSGQKSRVEGFTAGPLGKIVTIVRRDEGVTWTLYLDSRQYTEKPLAVGGQPGKVDLSNFDLGNLKKVNLGRETVLGYPCAKIRVTVGNLPNGQPMVATAWVADSLDLPLRLETMGIVQENRNLRTGLQPAALFEIPAGFTWTNAPGMPAGLTPPPGALAGRSASAAASSGAVSAAGRAAGNAAAVQVPPRRDDRQTVAGQTDSPAAAAAWKVNTNYPGGDYRSIDMATANPAACKAACEKETQCKAWTLVKPETPGGMGYCWLKDSVPPAIAEDCCISGLKGAGGAFGGQGGARASQYQLEMNANRGGEDYRDFIPARASAELCAEACAKEARCRAWTWVKNAVEPPTGHCWLKNPAPEPAEDDCCVSGVKK